MTTDKQESFEQLAQSLRSMNIAFQQSAASAINKHVTCRNWLNGYYIVHYEQNGSDRAKYGEKLLQKLAERLKIKGNSYKEGYVLSLISKKCYKGDIQYFELEKAIDINPSQVLPILIDDIQAEQLPNCLQNREVKDVSQILSDEEKVRAVVDALISFDLKNQYKK